MRSFFFKKSRLAAAGGIVLSLLLAVWVWAGITTSAGTYSISADTSSVGGSGAWTALGTMVYTEIANGDIATGGNLSLVAPAGYEFNTAAAVVATLIDGDGNSFKNMNETPVGGTFALSKSPSTISIFVSSKSQGNTRNKV